MALPSIFSLEHPVTRAVTVNGIQLVSQWWLQRSLKQIEAEYRDEYMSKIDEMIKRIDEKLAQLNQKVEQPEAEKPVNSKPKLVLENIRKNESQTTQSISTACLPCTRAHLITVSGTLKEALRFARDEGVKNKEVLDRIDAAAEELAVLERFDLAPEKIKAMNGDEQERIKAVLPEIRKLRQDIVNNIDSVEKLEEVAARTVEIYKQLREMAESSGEKDINWTEVENSLKEEMQEEV